MCTGTEVDSSAFEKSIVMMTQLINNDKNLYFLKQLHHSSIVHHHSQIIPSANRTKADKIKTLREIRERKLHSHELDDESMDEEEFDLDVQVEELGEIDEQSVTDEANYYKENIFNREDYYLFRAVMYFYSEDFDKAVADFKQTSKIMHANKNLNRTQGNFIVTDEDEKELDKMSNTSSQTDLSDVGLCSLNVHEFSYNITLCLIKHKKYEEAFEKVTFMLETLPKKYTKEVWLIRGILASIIGNYKVAKSDFAYAEKKDPENYNAYIKEKKPITLNVFPTAHRLCNYYPYVKVSFPSFPTHILMRPSFSFPFIKPPNMIPSIDDNIFEQFTINAIKIKPEAPWIKRNSYGIKFTDKIQTTEYEEDVELSDDDTTKDRKHSINPLLKRLYIRTNSQHYSRIKYFSKEQEREAAEQKDDDDYDDESKDGRLKIGFSLI